MTVLSTSPAGALVSVTVANGTDTSRPDAATGLAASLSGTSLRLDWAAASDDSGPVQRYRVLRDGMLLADVYATSVVDAAPNVGSLRRTT